MPPPVQTVLPPGPLLATAALSSSPRTALEGPSLEEDLRRARAGLVEAELALRPSDRYLQAHLAALRAAAVVLASRARPARSRRQGPRNVWHVLGEVAPELGEWAAFFAATQTRRDAVREGAWVAAREADDLVRDAEGFLTQVARTLPRRARTDEAPSPPVLAEGVGPAR